MRFVLIASSLLLASPASADTFVNPLWGRFELGAAELQTTGFGARAFEMDFYFARYGLGIGAGVWQGEWGGWDVERFGMPDASAHLLSTFGPVKAYATLWSFEGEPTYAGRQAMRTIGRLELFGEYSNWGKLWLFNEPPFPGSEDRVRIRGDAPARIARYGLRLDMGQIAGIAVGRREFRSRRTEVFKSRYDSTWFGQFYLFLGFNTGEQTGNIFWIGRDLAAGVKRLFHRDPDYTDIIVDD